MAGLTGLRSASHELRSQGGLRSASHELRSASHELRSQAELRSQGGLRSASHELRSQGELRSASHELRSQDGLLRDWMANLANWIKIKIITADRTYTWRNTHPTKIHCYYYNCGTNDAILDLLKTKEALKESLQTVLQCPDIRSIKMRPRNSLESNQIPIGSYTHKDIRLE